MEISSAYLVPMPMPLETPISTLDSQRPPCRLRSNVDSWDEWPWSVENETIKPWQGTLESQCDLKKPPLFWDLSCVSFFSHWWMRPFTTSTETPTIPFNTDLCRDALVHSRPHWEGKGLEVPMKGALGRNSFNMLGTSSTSMLPGKAIRCPSCLPIFWVCCTVNGSTLPCTNCLVLTVFVYMCHSAPIDPCFQCLHEKGSKKSSS